jgi:hypothetical protein
MKLLKQFHSLRATHTSLKRGANERAKSAGASAKYAVHLINTRLQSGVDVPETARKPV